jgi:hypothetical protein
MADSWASSDIWPSKGGWSEAGAVEANGGNDMRDASGAVVCGTSAA